LGELHTEVYSFPEASQCLRGSIRISLTLCNPLLIILIATLGKFGGTFVAARLTGLGSRYAAALGTLMNTRGLVELIVLNIGLDLWVISPTLFSMMVLMALVTTMVTSPVLRWLMPHTVAADA